VYLWRKGLTLYSIYTGFIACATSVAPDQLAHPCFLIWIYTVGFWVENNQMNLTMNNVDPDQMAQTYFDPNKTRLA
jgi:hypothetical protein